MTYCPQADTVDVILSLSLFLTRVLGVLAAYQDGEISIIPLLSLKAHQELLVWTLMQGDSSSHFSVQITSSSADIGKHEHTSQLDDQT